MHGIVAHPASCGSSHCSPLHRYHGPRAVKIPYNLETIPVFVRAGAIIPLDAKRQYSRQVVADPITFAVFPGADGSLDLYEDEGDTLSYKSPGAKKGRCCRPGMPRRCQPPDAALTLLCNAVLRIVHHGTRVGDGCTVCTPVCVLVSRWPRRLPHHASAGVHRWWRRHRHRQSAAGCGCSRCLGVFAFFTTDRVHRAGQEGVLATECFCWVGDRMPVRRCAVPAPTEGHVGTAKRYRQRYRTVRRQRLLW